MPLSCKYPQRFIVRVFRERGCLLSKGSLVSVWLVLNNMEAIIQNQGLQHIVEKSLMYLDKKSINSFQLVNNDFKKITESPRVLRVLKVRKLASVIKEFWVNVANFHVHYDTKGHRLSGNELKVRNGQWKNRLFQFLHEQSLNKVEVDHFLLLCKILDKNLLALASSTRTQNFHNLKELQVKFTKKTGCVVCVWPQ